jgi:hypothetical protein
MIVIITAITPSENASSRDEVIREFVFDSAIHPTRKPCFILPDQKYFENSSCNVLVN